MRSTSIEPLTEHLKSVFRIDPLPIRRYDKARAIVLLSVLLYKILVYYNCKTEQHKPDNYIYNKLNFFLNKSKLRMVDYLF